MIISLKHSSIKYISRYIVTNWNFWHICRMIVYCNLNMISWFKKMQSSQLASNRTTRDKIGSWKNWTQSYLSKDHKNICSRESLAVLSLICCGRHRFHNTYVWSRFHLSVDLFVSWSVLTSLNSVIHNHKILMNLFFCWAPLTLLDKAS